jgi:hypothetical protein
MNGTRFCWRVIRYAQARLEPARKTHAQRHIASIEEKDNKDDAKDDNQHKANFSDVETDDEATPINVWEARGKEN